MFLDRSDAGKQLADALKPYEDQSVVVYGLPRGGVVVAAEVAKALCAPLDILVTRKIGHPLSREYAIGAVSADGTLITNSGETDTLDPRWLAAEAAREQKEALRRQNLFMKGRVPVDVRDKVAIIVDDGIATGLTIEAAVRQLRERHAAKIVVAAPVAPESAADRLRGVVDMLVLLHEAHGGFHAIGAFYRNFEQVTDEEVLWVLQSVNKPAMARS